MQRNLTVILNKGSNEQEKLSYKQSIADSFSELGQQVNIIIPKKNDDFKKLCEKLVSEAAKNNDVIVAAGGDGTVNLLAGLCYRYKVTLGVIPLGTFNYFAREFSIPTEIKPAVEIITKGLTRKVTIGLVQDNVFLNNATFGLYTKLIRHREEASSRFGQIRIIAAFSAVYSLFQYHKSFSIKINSGETEEWHKTSMVFVGNNTLQLNNLGMEVADCTKQDKLAVIVMKQASRFEIARILLRGAIGSLKNEPQLKEFCADNFEVASNRKVIDMVIDGEIIRCTTPLKFRVDKNSLNVIIPAVENQPE